MERELAYYRKRSAEESARALSALNPKVRKVHLELAHRYDERVVALEAREMPLGLHVVAA